MNNLHIKNSNTIVRIIGANLKRAFIYLLKYSINFYFLFCCFKYLHVNCPLSVTPLCGWCACKIVLHCLLENVLVLVRLWMMVMCPTGSIVNRPNGRHILYTNERIAQLDEFDFCVFRSQHTAPKSGDGIAWAILQINYRLAAFGMNQ